MSNALYVKGRQHFLEGSIAWLSDNIKVVLLDTAIYTRNLSTDEFLSDIAGGARVATSGNLASKTSTGGTADAADVTFTAVTGAQCSQIGGYKDTGVAATSPLIVNYDTATNLPVTPNGGDIAVQWDAGTNKMFTLMQGVNPDDVAGLMGAISSAGWRHLRDQLTRWLRSIGVDAHHDRPRGRVWVPAPRVILSPKLIV